MSEIHIRRSHRLSLAKARAAAEKIARSLEQEFDLSWEWEGDALNFRRAGVTGALSVSRQEIDIRVRLGFLLLPLRARVEREIHAYCDGQFGKSARSLV